MNIELKPIAESKVRQLGGDVCGVLVRKDGRLAAVDEHGRVTWLPDGTDYAAISSRAIGDIAKVTELLGVPEEEAGRPIVELVKEYLAAQSCNSAPSEQGKNRYGLDMAYFRELFNRELNRPLVDFRPDELARVLARAARTADAAVLQEPEFQAARAQGGQGAEPVGSIKSCACQFTAEGGLLKECLYHQTRYKPQPAVPEGFALVPESMCLSYQDIESIITMTGWDEGQDNFGEGVLWVGALKDDDGNETYGLHISCIEVMEEGALPVQEFQKPELSTPATPHADGWVRCDERLPTEEDWWVWIYDSEDGDIFHALWRDLKGDYENGHMNLSHWMPTGLKRPDIPRC